MAEGKACDADAERLKRLIEAYRGCLETGDRWSDPTGGIEHAVFLLRLLRKAYAEIERLKHEVRKTRDSAAGRGSPCQEDKARDSDAERLERIRRFEKIGGMDEEGEFLLKQIDIRDAALRAAYAEIETTRIRLQGQDIAARYQ